MFTQLEIAGMVALVAAIFGAGFLIQRLDSAIAGGDETLTTDGSADEPAAEHAPEQAAPRAGGAPAQPSAGGRGRQRRRKR